MGRHKLILLHCWCCGEYKPLSQFYRDKAKWSGRQSACRGCTKEIQSDYLRQYYLNHRDTLLPKHRETAMRSYKKKMLAKARND